MKRTRNIDATRLGLLALGVALAGCSLADKALLDALDPDAGNNGDSGSSNVGVTDQCGDADVRVIQDTEEDIAIDTRSLIDSVSSLAGCSQATPGKDGFLAVDVQAGEYWHFHLRVDQANDPDPTSHNPILYLLDTSCSGTTCNAQQLANFCDQNQDEHFGITFASSGRFYIGIDDGNSGGAAYLLDAVRPICDGTPEHGEACDGDAECSNDCLRILSSDSRQESGFNFNAKEANFVTLGGRTGNLTINGDIGGLSGCAYPDVYGIDVPALGKLTVTSQLANGTGCIIANQLSLELRNAEGRDLGNDDGFPNIVNGCRQIERTFVGGTRVFVVVRDQRVDSGAQALPYRLNFDVTAP